MNLLAVDCASSACSGALLINDQIIEQFAVAPRQHSYLLLEQIKKLLAEASISFKQLDAIAFGQGPGSFTGLRIAASSAQALAVAHDLPMVGVCSLQALAYQAYKSQQENTVLACLDARLGEIYAAYFHHQAGTMTRTGNIQLCRPEQLALHDQAFALIGSGFDAYHDLLLSHCQDKVSKSITDAWPHARDVAELAKHSYLSGQRLLPEQAIPTYIRDNVV